MSRVLRPRPRFMGNESESLLGRGKTTTISAGWLTAAVLGALSIGFLIWAIVMTVRANPPVTSCGPGITFYSDEGECVDVIIVGGGTAGSVLAKKLTDPPLTHEVLVLEVGQDNWEDFGDPDGPGPDPSIFFLQDQTQDPCSISTSYCSKDLGGPEPGLTSAAPNIFSGGAFTPFNAGRSLGGGSAINNMIVMRGTQAYWDTVATFVGTADNGDRWGGVNIHAVMKAQEYLNEGAAPAFSPDLTRSTDNTHRWSVAVRPTNGTNAAFDSWIDTIAQAYNDVYPGFPDADIGDYNSGTAVLGAHRTFQFQHQHDNGFVRESTDRAFLSDAEIDRTTTPYTGVGGRKLTVRTGANVKSLIWDPADPIHCIGAEYTTYVDGVVKVRKAYARRTVVLSANIQNPGILQREGIGPAATLAAAGVPVTRVINENVGRHLQTHTITPVLHITNFTGLAPQFDPEGPNGFSFVPIIGGIQVPDPESPSTGRAAAVFLFRLGDGADFGPYDPGTSAIVALAQLSGCDSRGTIDISTCDPDQSPNVVVNALWNGLPPPPFGAGGPSDDLRVIRQVHQDFVTFMSPHIVDTLNFDTMATLDVLDDDVMNAYIKQNTDYAHHWAGFTRMGPTSVEGVVSKRTRVFGTRGLRICDCGILPTVPDGNTATPAVAIGDVCGTFLLEDLALGAAMDASAA